VATPDGTRVYGNHVMLDYYGLTIETLQDSGIEELVRGFMHPDDIEMFLAAWQRGFAGTASWETEARFRRRDGEYRWFLVRFTPLRDDEGRIVRWYITGTDIDDRKKAEEKVRQDERELRIVVDFVPQHLVAFDAQGRVLYANRAALEFTGLSLDETAAHTDVWRQTGHPGEIPTPRARGGEPAGVFFQASLRMRRGYGECLSGLVRVAPAALC